MTTPEGGAILSNRTNWPEWHVELKARTLEAGAWPYFDPDTAVPEQVAVSSVLLIAYLWRDKWLPLRTLHSCAHGSGSRDLPPEQG